jgi:hypothetical protein
MMTDVETHSARPKTSNISVFIQTALEGSLENTLDREGKYRDENAVQCTGYTRASAVGRQRYYRRAPPIE